METAFHIPAYRDELESVAASLGLDLGFGGGTGGLSGVYGCLDGGDVLPIC